MQGLELSFSVYCLLFSVKLVNCATTRLLPLPNLHKHQRCVVKTFIAIHVTMKMIMANHNHTMVMMIIMMIMFTMMMLRKKGNLEVPVTLPKHSDDDHHHDKSFHTHGDDHHDKS